MSSLSGENSNETIGPYLLASVVIVCFTFIVKGDLLTFGSKDIGLQIDSTKEALLVAIDKGIINLSNKFDVHFSRFENKIDSLERKIDIVESEIERERVQRCLASRNLRDIDLNLIDANKWYCKGSAVRQ